MLGSAPNKMSKNTKSEDDSFLALLFVFLDSTRLSRGHPPTRMKDQDTKKRTARPLSIIVIKMN